VKKRRFRALWIQRINAAAREVGLKYSTFIDALTKAEVGVDRKMLAKMAVEWPDAFKVFVDKAKARLASAKN
jgi:large subunit ribosomal protein L20